MDVLDRWRRRAAALYGRTERLERAVRRSWRRAQLPGAVVRVHDRVTLRLEDGTVQRARVGEVVDVDGHPRLVLRAVSDPWPGWVSVLMDQYLAGLVANPRALTGLGGWDVPPRRPGDDPPAGGAIGPVRPDGTAGLFQFMPPTQFTSPMEYAQRAMARGEARPLDGRSYLAGRYGYWTGTASRRAAERAQGKPVSPPDPPEWLQECIDTIVALWRPAAEALQRDVGRLIERFRAEQAARLGGVEASDVLIDEAAELFRRKPIDAEALAGQARALRVQSVISPELQATINAAVRVQLEGERLFSAQASEQAARRGMRRVDPS